MKGLRQAEDRLNSDLDLNKASTELTNTRKQTEVQSARAAKAQADQAETQNDILKAAKPALIKLAPITPYLDAAGKGTGAVGNLLDSMNIFKRIISPRESLERTQTIEDMNPGTGEIYRTRTIKTK